MTLRPAVPEDMATVADIWHAPGTPRTPATCPTA